MSNKQTYVELRLVLTHGRLRTLVCTYIFTKSEYTKIQFSVPNETNCVKITESTHLHTFTCVRLNVSSTFTHRKGRHSSLSGKIIWRHYVKMHVPTTSILCSYNFVLWNLRISSMTCWQEYRPQQRNFLFLYA